VFAPQANAGSRLSIPAWRSALAVLLPDIAVDASAPQPSAPSILPRDFRSLKKKTNKEMLKNDERSRNVIENKGSAKTRFAGTR
jgi:hypothetical protein